MVIITYIETLGAIKGHEDSSTGAKHRNIIIAETIENHNGTK